MKFNRATEVFPSWPAWVTLVPLPDSRLYVASESDLSCVLEGIDPLVQGWLAQLDGNRAWTNQIDEADARGIDIDLADRLVSDLWAAGLLTDAAVAPVVLADHGIVGFGSGVLSDELRRLLPGISWAGPIPRSWEPDHSQDGPDGPCAGDSPAATGVDRAVRKARIALLVLQGAVADSVEVAFAQRLQAAGAIVLVVGAGTRSGRVGPLTVPDESPCLRCEDLERAALDAHWPTVARQLALGPAGPADSLIAAATAAEAVRALHAYVSANGPRSSAVDGSKAPGSCGAPARASSHSASDLLSGVIELGSTGGPWTYRRLQPNRSCGCWWSD